MNRAPSIQFLTSAPSRKRRHEEISSSDSEPTEAGTHAENFASSSRSSERHSRPFLEIPRFDYRRPVMSTGIPPSPSVENQRTDVIDLTQDDSNSPPRLAPQTPSTRPNEASRPPRFGRNIMADVVDLEQEPTAVPSNDQQSSPEVQWLGSYSRAGPSTTSTTSNAEAGAAYHNHQRTLRGSNLLNLLSAENYRLPPVPMNRADVFREEMALRTRHLVGAFRQAMSPFWVGLPPRDTSDFDLHDLSLTYLRASEPGHPRRGPAPQVPPAYEAPAAPPEGFTTCANEDEVVVCPNCDRELGTGESPEQKQVWVARHCGHVYCGLCTKNRAARGKRAANAETRYFSKCVVSDCGKSVSQPKAMLQIYL